MTISVGDTLPGATLLKMGAAGPEPVELDSLVKGKKVVLFAVPAAFSGTCSTAHMPSFIRTKAQFEAKGIEEVICVAVNDPFVLGVWARETGADAAGIHVLGDAESRFTAAMGMQSSAPQAGLINRSKRYALMAEDGVVKVLHLEENSGVCETSGGESLLDDL